MYEIKERDPFNAITELAKQLKASGNSGMEWLGYRRVGGGEIRIGIEKSKAAQTEALSSARLVERGDNEAGPSAEDVRECLRSLTALLTSGTFTLRIGHLVDDPLTAAGETLADHANAMAERLTRPTAEPDSDLATIAVEVRQACAKQAAALARQAGLSGEAAEEIAHGIGAIDLAAIVARVVA